MIFTCPSCGESSEVRDGVRPAFCPLCGAAAGREEDGWEAWKRPLYDRAVSLPQWENFARLQTVYMFLGDYRDAAARLRGLNEELERWYRDAAGMAENGRTEAELEAAVGKLEVIREYRDCLERIDRTKARIAELRRRREAEEAEARARAEALSRRRRRVGGAIASVVCTVLIVVLGALYYRDSIVPQRMLYRGNDALRAGNYDQAIRHYREAEAYDSTKLDAENAVRRAYAAWGNALVQAGDYAGALDKFEKSGSKPVGEDVARVMLLLDEAKYGDALALCEGLTASDFKSAGIRMDPDDIRALWCDQRSDGGDLDGALEVAEGIGDAALRKEKLQQALMKRAGDGEWLKALQPEAAGRYGALLTDIDAQLEYCHRLYEAGFSLHDVYPQGVQVDLPMDALPLKAPEGGSPDLSHPLLVERVSDATDGAPRSEVTVGDDGELARQAADGEFTHFNTRLMAGAAFALAGADVPATWADCTAVMTVDRLRLPWGIVEVRLEEDGVAIRRVSLEDYKAEGGFAFRRQYVYFCAWSAAQLFDLRDSAAGRVFDTLLDVPACDDETLLVKRQAVFNAARSKVDLSDLISPFRLGILDKEDMVASFDDDWIQEAYVRAFEALRKMMEGEEP